VLSIPRFTSTKIYKISMFHALIFRLVTQLMKLVSVTRDNISGILAERQLTVSPGLCTINTNAQEAGINE